MLVGDGNRVAFLSHGGREMPACLRVVALPYRCAGWTALAVIDEPYPLVTARLPLT